MTPAEKSELGVRLIRMQSLLRATVEACDAQGELCRQMGEEGLAFASFMVGESISVFCDTVTKFVDSALDS